MGGIPLWRLFIHDWSKFSTVERRGYTKVFFQKGHVAYDADIRAARKHHHAHNPHHRHFWEKDGEPIPMPETYVREMVVDWIAAERAYGKGTRDITPWLAKEYPTMNLHPVTWERLHGVLAEVGVDVGGLRRQRKI